MAQDASATSKKPVILIVIVAVLSALAGAGVTYLALKDKIVLRDSPVGDNSTTQEQATAPSLEETLPQGTISPTTIAAKPNDYDGKEVKVRGLIVETSDGQYIIVGQEIENPGSIALDFSGTKVDPKPYIGAHANLEEGQANLPTVGAVTVTGKISKDPDLKLTVKAIKE